ncbi:MAG: hypothetical protein K6U11_10865 [bacterium]|nr:hypothetical protein [bacterium]
MESLGSNLISLLGTLEIIIPMKQVIFLIALSVFFILIGRFKSALIANLTFIFFWTCIASKSLSGKYSLSTIAPFVTSYAVVGSAIFFGIALMIFYAISE